MLREALSLDEKVFGNSGSILESLGKVGRDLSDLAKYTEMEKKFREELAVRKKTLGSDHAQTLRSMNKLRSTLHRQCEYRQAEEMQRQILAQHNKIFGTEHPETLRQRGHLAQILACQTKYAEAVQTERDTLALKDRILGEQHPDTLSSVLHLAQYLDDEGKYDECVVYYERASTGYRDTLGPDHPTTKRWTFIYDALREVVDIGDWKKSKGPETTNAASVSTVSDTQASNTNELTLRPKQRWRPDLKKWKAGKDTLHRWFTEEDMGKERKRRDLA